LINRRKQNEGMSEEKAE